MGETFDLLHAAFLGLVEGLTEFLPISSTGHLIMADMLFERSDPSFEIAIQTGAITAIVVLYRKRLVRALLGLWKPRAGTERNLLVLIAVASLPAAVLGLLLEKQIHALLFNATTVALAMAGGGIALLWLEIWLAARARRGLGADDRSMTLRCALVIGLFQCLALVPGVSRSGATIAGALIMGLRRPAAAEFSFLLGLPILYGAALLEVVKEPEMLTGPRLPALLVAWCAALVTALVIVRPFVRFLTRHTFVVFAWYRLVAGILLLVLIAAGLVAGDPR